MHTNMHKKASPISIYIPSLNSARVHQYQKHKILHHRKYQFFHAQKTQKKSSQIKKHIP